MRDPNWLKFCGSTLLLFSCLAKAADPIGLVSASDRVSSSAAGNSFTPAFSADGRLVVFVSHANNLVTNQDLSPQLNVFARDLASSNTVLVSASSANNSGGNGDSSSPSVSSNGQFVAFVSAASNLVDNDTNDAPDIFVRDLSSGQTKLVTVDVTGNASARPASPLTRFRLSRNPLISGDGRWVVFESLSPNLVSLADTNQMADVFARDLQSNTTLLLSVNAAGTASGNGNSELAGMTPDGRFVVFVSTATDLVPGATNQFGDIYIRDLQAGTTILASSGVAGLFAPYPVKDYRCLKPVLSESATVLVFMATSPAFSNDVLLIRRDLQVGTNSVLEKRASTGSWPDMSADGRFIAGQISTNVWVWDAQTGSNGIANINRFDTGPANQPASTPVLTRDGRSVVFLSAATDLAPNATNGVRQIYIRDLEKRTTRLVSGNLDGAASSGGVDATLPVISSDGHYIGFESSGDDLVAADLNQASDIFLRNLDTDRTLLISEQNPNRPAKTGTRAAGTFLKSISADGRYVALKALDNIFTPNDTNGFPDAFVRDLGGGTLMAASVGNTTAFSTNQATVEAAMSANGRYVVFGWQDPRDNFSSYSFLTEQLFLRDLGKATTVLVSMRADGTGAASSSCSSPAISSNGNLVAFQSKALDLITGLSNSTDEIFLRDTVLGTTKLVSFNRLQTGGGDAPSFNPIFSPDDQWIVFASSATNLANNDTGGMTNLFAMFLPSKTNRMISVGMDGSRPLGYLRGAVFDANSQHLAFVSASNAVAVYDLAHQSGVVVCTACDNPSLSANGRLVAYETCCEGSPREIVVKDLLTGTTNLISRSFGGTGGGNGDSTGPLLSSDGRFVVFASRASDLVDNDTNGVSDIFVRDRLLGTTMLVSLNLEGVSGNGPSTKPALAADGRTVIFQSFASDLVPGDYNDSRDVFVLRLGGVDSDGDGMDDDWEMAYFGTLSRDGTGDFDGDGQTDLQEFLAGTDPTNSGSVLRVLTLNLLGGGGTKVIWSAAPGKTYRVQFKDDIADSVWRDLGVTVTASATTMSAIDPAGSGGIQRFYRVVFTP